MRKGTIAIALVAAFLVGATVVSLARPTRISKPTRVHVIEHAVSDTVIDLAAAGDSSGDLLTFHNPIYNAVDTKQVGRDQGECIRISPHAGTWECRWITYLNEGAITVEGPFFDGHNSVVAITGGRGIYANARGTMDLKFRASGTKFDFVFHVLP